MGWVVMSERELRRIEVLSRMDGRAARRAAEAAQDVPAPGQAAE